MSQSFKLKYDLMKDGNPTSPESSNDFESKAFELSYAQSNARNICFVWPDGKRIFLNYSYLVSGEYLPEDNVISLAFVSQTVVLKGIHLETLFYDIMGHLSKQIVCMDARYNLVEEIDRYVVNDIQVIKNN